jgi:hypothetical protein
VFLVSFHIFLLNRCSIQKKNQIAFKPFHMRLVLYKSTGKTTREIHLIKMFLEASNVKNFVNEYQEMDHFCPITPLLQEGLIHESHFFCVGNVMYLQVNRVLLESLNNNTTTKLIKKSSDNTYFRCSFLTLTPTLRSGLRVEKWYLKGGERKKGKEFEHFFFQLANSFFCLRQGKRFLLTKNRVGEEHLAICLNLNDGFPFPYAGRLLHLVGWIMGW